MSGHVSVCFVSMEAYATLRPGVAKEAGGAGFQVVQLARGLRDLGHPVGFVVGDYGQPTEENIDGFLVLRANRVAYDRSIRRGLSNLWRLWQAMRRADADFYVLRSTRFLAPFVYLYSRLLGRRYVFMVASLSHILDEELEGLGGLFRRLYIFTLRKADRVTVQSCEQQVLLDNNFGVRASVVPNGIEVPPFRGPRFEAEYDAAWIGTIKPVKRPDRLLAFAAAHSGLRLLVVGGPGSDHGYYERMVRAFAAAPNIDYVGFIPPNKIHECYDKARLLLNTSDYEGFPNTFLYAWSRGIPVASLDVDPDNVLSGDGLGVIDPSPERLAGLVAELLADEGRYAEMARRCHEHVSRVHALPRAVEAFLAALTEGKT